MITLTNLISGDSFDRSDGPMTGMSSNSGLILPWTNTGQSVVSNRLQRTTGITANSGSRIIVPSDLIVDVEASLTIATAVTAPIGQGPGLLLRANGDVTPTSPCLMLRATNTASMTWQLYQFGGGSGTILLGTGTDPGIAVGGRLRLQYHVDLTLTALINNTVLYHGTHPNALSTSGGMGVRYAGSAAASTLGSIDDFAVHRLFPTTYLGDTPIRGAYIGTQPVRAIK